MKKRLLILILTFVLFFNIDFVFASEFTKSYIVNVNVENINKGYKDNFEKQNYKAAKEISDKSLTSFQQKLEENFPNIKVKGRISLLLPSLLVEGNDNDIEKIKSFANVENVYENRTLIEDKPVERAGYYSRDQKQLMMSSNLLIGNDEELQRKYDGEGRVLAVIDGNMEPDNSCFRLDSNYKRYDSNDIYNIVNSGLTYGRDYIRNIYKSDKVPFAFNYRTGTTDLNPEGERVAHGQHVCGTVAGNRFNFRGETFRGVAPESQLLMMNVMRRGSTNSFVYIKAMSDALVLKADAVNMSLGSTKGQMQNLDPAIVEAVNRGYNSNTNFVIAAGNEGDYKGDLSSDNPDYGGIGDPGIVENSITVASLENEKIFGRAIEIAGVKYSYENSNFLLRRGYYDVVDCGEGKAEDFSGKNLYGKIALVKRGTNSFNEKIAIAENAGAKAIIIFNNIKGSLWVDGRNANIPVYTIANKPGEILKSIENKRVYLNTRNERVENPLFGEISDFSNWGLTSGGYMKPDITAPGGNIMSTTTVDGSFANMSGTSMATPHVTGAIGVLREALDDNPIYSNIPNKAKLVKQLIMNSAVPHTDPFTHYLTSPRRQGAGVLNLKNAVDLDFTVVDAKSEIPSRFLGNINNELEFNLIIKNYSNERKVLIPSIATTVEKRDGKKLLLRPDELFSRNFDDSPLVLRPKEERKVSFSIPIENLDKIKDFSNGLFVEGFLNFKDQNNKSANFAFVGFKGSFEKIPGIEKPIYDFDFANENPMYYRINSVSSPWYYFVTSLITNKNINTQYGYSNINVIAGMSNFIDVNNSKNTRNEVKPNFENIVISPNNDGNNDKLNLSLVATRNGLLSVKLKDDQNNTYVYSRRRLMSNFSADPDNAGGRYGFDGYTFIKNPIYNLNDLKDGKYELILETMADNYNYSGETNSSTIKFNIDRKAPTLKDVVVTENENTLTISFSANDLSFIRSARVELGRDYQNLKPENGRYTIYCDKEDLPHLRIRLIDGGYNESLNKITDYKYVDNRNTLRGSLKINAIKEVLPSLNIKLLDENNNEVKELNNLKLGNYKLYILGYDENYELLGNDSYEFVVDRNNLDYVLDLQFKEKEKKALVNFIFKYNNRPIEGIRFKLNDDVYYDGENEINYGEYNLSLYDNIEGFKNVYGKVTINEKTKNVIVNLYK
ncbi:S8 family serine peptidase [Peptoniphilus sp. MSJ-1]|uniref:S8 family serine peptidase n=1 Tax=Peptoniphilus ovalis TaxID=2841503 RepID=A0ABS6FJF2_9FIRM|nr:S8 family serine peptidase [Peptoniphilus ovalis]MBU5669376.1 S8 family serine peptidase [Peptoniphilus ovalis]